MTKRAKIYMDYSATTPIDELVLARMNKTAREIYGNPGSIHSFGVSARRELENARKEVALILGAKKDEVIFTSGGTESDNLAILGVAREAKKREPNKKHHIIISAIEHHAVLKPAEELAKEGFEISYLKVSPKGIINPEDLKKLLKENTILISVIYANNEIGTIQPIREMGQIIKKERARRGGNYPVFHSDACQAPAFLNIKVETLGVDLFILSASKIYGPKNSGILFVKNGTPIAPIIFGGGQERGLRSGTPDVVNAVGFAEALKIADGAREKESKRLCELRDFFIAQIKLLVPDCELNGDAQTRLPNNANIYFPRVDAERFVVELDVAGFAVSMGSACSSYDDKPSYVLLAISNKDNRAKESVRFSFGKSTSKKDILALLEVILAILRRIRQ